ncbi:MAG: hypothetical protein QOC68_2907 [Solirubrobacteraceae bacterium]|jgi:hypothetical protein|nr:hypothetical protein [Solirubrobacteraceae bacterium]
MPTQSWTDSIRRTARPPDHMDVKSRMKRLALVPLLCAGLLSLAPASALALQAPSPDAAVGCATPTLAPALAAFGDARSYFLAPGGDFESTTNGWRLTGGASLSPGSGPLGLGAAAKSLRLPAGASATSPVFCVDLEYPTLRFFAAKGRMPLNVDVIYPVLGASRPKVATLPGGTAAWALSKDVSLRPETVTRDAGWRQVQLRFVAVPGATDDWFVDDVLVDPRMRG